MCMKIQIPLGTCMYIYMYMYMHVGKINNVHNIYVSYKRCLTYHPVPEPELSGAEYSVALLCEVGDLVLAVLLTRLDVRPVLAATNFAPFNYLCQHHNQCTALLPYHLPVCECMILCECF